MSFARKFVDELKDEDTSLMSDGVGASEFTGWVDTGCLAFNAAMSGSLYGGIPNNKVVMFGGDPATGKTYFMLSVLANFQVQNPEGIALYYDTETAVTKQMMESRGIDTTRVIRADVQTIQSFRTKVIRFLDKYEKEDEKTRPPAMLFLDSLGALSSEKEMTDTQEGKDTRDMTKAGLIKGLFRVLRIRLARSRVPMLVTNHVYTNVGGYGPPKIPSGGSGPIYNSDTIVTLAKAKDTEGEGDNKEVVGTILTVGMFKSRLSKENTVVKLRLSYETGLDRYYGLRAIAEKHGIFKKVSTRYELPDGRKLFGKQIDNGGEDVYTPEVLAQIEKACAKEFKYGVAGE
jgi:RecA/RadA recombinase